MRRTEVEPLVRKELLLGSVLVATGGPAAAGSERKLQCPLEYRVGHPFRSLILIDSQRAVSLKVMRRIDPPGCIKG